MPALKQAPLGQRNSFSKEGERLISLVLLQGRTPPGLCDTVPILSFLQGH